MHPLAAGQLRLAAAQGNVKNLEILRSARKFDIEASVEGFTPLHAACVAGKPAAVEWLLQHGTGEILCNRYLRCIATPRVPLLHTGANIHAMKNDHWNDTALHYAAASGNVRCCEILVANGASFRAKNFAGLTPRDYAFGNNHYDVVKYLDNLKRNAINQEPSLLIENKDLRAGQIFYNAQAVKRAPDMVAETDSGPETVQKRRRELNNLCRRAFEGMGTPGTKRTHLNRWFRFWAVMSTVLGGLYLIWRATRSLTRTQRGTHGQLYVCY